MKLEIRKGTMQDIEELTDLYDTLNDYLTDHTNYPGWKKGVYPIREDAIDGVKDDALYVAIKENKIVGSLILSHKPEEAYNKVRWKKDISYDKVFVIYTFVVHPVYFHQEIGSHLLEFAEKTGQSYGIESLRLDVYEGNLPAIHLYEKNGFEYTGTVSLGLEKYGLDWFKLYEKKL